MVEVVLPSVVAQVAERRPLGAGLAEHLAQPVDAGAGGVTHDRPHRPVLRLGPQRELLVGQRADRLDEALVVLRPTVVEQADAHA
jgi:hypothetical protein